MRRVLGEYARYWRINLLTMLEYRANFIMWSLFTVIYHATAIAALWVTLRNSHRSTAGTFGRPRSCTALDARQRTAQYALLHRRQVPEFVREGRFDRFLIRPLDPLFQTLTAPQQIFPDELILSIGTSASRCRSRGARRLGADLLLPLVAIGAR